MARSEKNLFQILPPKNNQFPLKIMYIHSIRIYLAAPVSGTPGVWFARYPRDPFLETTAYGEAPCFITPLKDPKARTPGPQPLTRPSPPHSCSPASAVPGGQVLDPSQPWAGPCVSQNATRKTETVPSIYNRENVMEGLGHMVMESLRS